MKKLLSAALIFSASITNASDNWVSSSSVLVRDSQNQCVRNGVWTPATAHPACVPDLAPRPQPPAPAAPSVQAPKPGPVAPAPRSAPPASVPQSVTFQAETLFDFDRSVIKPEGRRILDGFVTSLNGSRAHYDTVIVIGHTDSIGSDTYNLRLGQRRAEAVKAYLISRGIDSRAVRTLSRGEREPVADNRTVAGRAKNRRVVIEVKATR